MTGGFLLHLSSCGQSRLGQVHYRSIPEVRACRERLSKDHLQQFDYAVYWGSHGKQVLKQQKPLQGQLPYQRLGLTFALKLMVVRGEKVGLALAEAGHLLRKPRDEADGRVGLEPLLLQDADHKGRTMLTVAGTTNICLQPQSGHSCSYIPGSRQIAGGGLCEGDQQVKFGGRSAILRVGITPPPVLPSRESARRSSAGTWRRVGGFAGGPSSGWAPEEE